MNPRKPFFITSEDAALREFVHSPGKLHKEQRAAVELGKILLELCNCADRLYRLANEGTGIDIVLRGEMQGYARVVNDICGALSSQIEYEYDY